MSGSRRAAFFDMDRTLIRVNTAARFARAQVRRGETRRRDLAVMATWFVRYTFGVLDADSLAKRGALGLKGIDEAQFRAMQAEWMAREIARHVRGPARSEVDRRRAEGAICVVLTSSTVYAAEPLAKAMGIDHVIASELQVHEGRFTGRYVGPLCYGPRKVERAMQFAAEHDIDLSQSAFYTDSISDLPMLERVGEPVAVNPDPRLWWLARKKAWRIERW